MKLPTKSLRCLDAAKYPQAAAHHMRDAADEIDSLLDRVDHLEGLIANKQLSHEAALHQLADKLKEARWAASRLWMALDGEEQADSILLPTIESWSKDES